MNPKSLLMPILGTSCVLAGCLLEFALAPAKLSAQGGLAIRVGGAYDHLAPEQQALVRAWHEEYARITGKKVDPKDGYDSLKLSVRTTFGAVTHALLQTELTDSDGKPLGNALSLVKLVESVHGEIPKTRGDQQFRVYTRLQDDALKKLYQCTQFRRTADNSVYHRGYPINFRQQGGAPSIQFSITRTGLRADIDVDYRSSSGPQALVNGHLTSGNSDVRAGSNFIHHVGRWEGLSDWWRGLFRLSPAIDQSDLQALASISKPRVSDSQPVQAAVLDFYKSWLVDKKPELALSYFSVKSNACITSFNSGESAYDNLIQLRLLHHMREANQQLGDVKNLDDVLHAVVMLAPGAQPIQQTDGSLFAIAHITDRDARIVDCRRRQHLARAEALREGTDNLGDYYSASTVIRSRGDTDQGQLLYQLWHREEGTWKVTSYHLDNPLANDSSPKLAKPEASETGGPRTASADPGLAPSTELFLKTWLVARNTTEAMKFVAPEARACVNLDGVANKQSLAQADRTWFKAVANRMPKAETLPGVMQRVEFSHSQMQEINHPNQDSYLLVRVSDDLASMYSCASRSAGVKPGPSETMGKAFYTLNVHQTLFQPRHKSGDRGTVVLTWARRQNRWMVTAFDIVTY